MTDTTANIQGLGNSNVEELERLSDDLVDRADDPPVAHFNALALLVAAAASRREQPFLELAVDRLNRVASALRRSGALEAAGQAKGIAKIANLSARFGIARELEDALMERDTHAHRMLALIEHEQNPDSRHIAATLGMRVDEVSRQGRRLLENGLAIRVPAGRSPQWEITPRGEDVLRVLGRRPDTESPATIADPANKEAWRELQALAAEMLVASMRLQREMELVDDAVAEAIWSPPELTGFRTQLGLGVTNAEATLNCFDRLARDLEPG